MNESHVTIICIYCSFLPSPLLWLEEEEDTLLWSIFCLILMIETFLQSTTTSLQIFFVATDIFHFPVSSFFLVLVALAWVVIVGLGLLFFLAWKWLLETWNLQHVVFGMMINFYSSIDCNDLRLTLITFGWYNTSRVRKYFMVTGSFSLITFDLEL